MESFLKVLYCSKTFPASKTLQLQSWRESTAVLLILKYSWQLEFSPPSQRPPSPAEPSTGSEGQCGNTASQDSRWKLNHIQPQLPTTEAPCSLCRQEAGSENTTCTRPNPPPHCPGKTYRYLSAIACHKTHPQALHFIPHLKVSREANNGTALASLEGYTELSAWMEALQHSRKDTF